ncbi:MAG: hypothetical protein DHS20C18_29320 [Saprospiraceae bacterium]|nr:MAG: hypothetical protein DHS20C18_29320 [Saprospiraceae bacterium]
MKCNTIIATVAFLLLLAPMTFAQNVTKEAFEAYQTKMEKELQQLKNNVAKKDLALETSKIYYDKAVEHLTLNEQLNGWYVGLYTAIFAFVGFVVGFIGFNFFNTQNRIKKYKEETQKELYQQLSLWVGANEAAVKLLLKEQEKKEALKENTSILVISHTSDKEQRPYKDLKGHGFKKILTPIKLGNSFDINTIGDISDIDVLILDNQHKEEDGNWNFSNEEMKEKLKALMQKVNEAGLHFVYYGENNNWDGRIKALKEWTDGEEKVIATTITTLRRNLLELIFPTI